MVWSNREWCDRRYLQSEMASRLESAGWEPIGWCNGKPEFAEPVDWEVIQAICEGDREVPATKPIRSKQNRRRK
jgi:hypothetical protein